MARTLLVLLAALFFAACVSGPQTPVVSNAPQEIVLKIESNQPIEKINIEEPSNDSVSRTMTVPNDEGELSMLSFISRDRTVAFIKLFSGIGVTDVTRFWNDVNLLRVNTDIRELVVFINSPGGDAFSGLVLADEIERAKSNGFKIIAHASGIIASAAVPVFAVCSERNASPGTIFMVHEASLWKWPGRETASDIRSQGELMDLLRERYMEKMIINTNKDLAFWEELEKRTTWFSAKTAMEWGLVDKIE